MMISSVVSYKEGEIASINHLDDIQSLPSAIKAVVYAKIGDWVPKTVDIRTDFGYVLLCHENPDQVIEDFKTVTEKYQNDILKLL